MRQLLLLEEKNNKSCYLFHFNSFLLLH